MKMYSLIDDWFPIWAGAIKRQRLNSEQSKVRPLIPILFKNPNDVMTAAALGVATRELLPDLHEPLSKYLHNFVHEPTEGWLKEVNNEVELVTPDGEAPRL
jgi:hypothetical protein